MAEHSRMEMRPQDSRPGSLGELIHAAVRRRIRGRPHERSGWRCPLDLLVALARFVAQTCCGSGPPAPRRCLRRPRPCGSRSIARLHGPGTSGTPAGRPYRKLLNTGAAVYGGSNVGNAGGVTAEARPWTGQPWSVILTLPPLGVLVLKPGAA